MKGIWPVKNWVLVLWLAHLIAAVVTTTSIIQ